MSKTVIKDHSIWFKDISDAALRDALARLRPGEAVCLDAGGVVGRWLRMKAYPDGTMTPGIRPDGEMKIVWNSWFKSRKGEQIELRPAMLADEYLAAQAALFSEWNSPEDEEAFRDL